MINFPEATKVHRRIPKEAFYKHLQMNTALKERFVTDVERLVVENSLTNNSLNLTADSDNKEILLLSISLKKREFDSKIIEAIARQNPHRLVFLITYEDEQQLAIYHRKLYRTDWMKSSETVLEARGYTLDEIWDGIIEQIALYEERSEAQPSMTIEERLAIQDQILKLEKLITKTEAAAWKEQQPKKRFELYSKLQSYKEQLEELKHGQS